MSRRLKAKRGRLAGFLRATRGVAAVEFALIVPMLLALYLGSIEINMAVSAQQKVQHTAAVIGDLIGREQSITAAQVRSIFGIHRATMQPYGDEPTRITAWAVENEDGEAETSWSLSNTSGMTLPSAAVDKVAGASSGNLFIVVKTEHDHAISAPFLDTTLTLGGLSVSRARYASSDLCEDC